MLEEELKINEATQLRVEKLAIKGFRSLKDVIWTPGSLNTIIGPNGTGKSNLLRFLELISISAQGKLGKHIQALGGMEPIVWDGLASSIEFRLDTNPVGQKNGPEHYELELSRLGNSSSYRISHEILANCEKVRLKESLSLSNS